MLEPAAESDTSFTVEPLRGQDTLGYDSHHKHGFGPERGTQDDNYEKNW